MCGLDGRTVKLTQVAISATLETHAGARNPQTATVCEDCKKLLLGGNYPSNQNLSEQGDVNQQGFVKPSQNETPKPAIRPNFD
jgi:hypothetical protein